MNLLDIRTIIYLSVITNAVCFTVMTLLWFRNRQRFDGLDYWLAGFAFQFMAILLVALPGVISDFLSIVASNTLVILGIFLLLMGLERFVGKRSRQVHNYILLCAFASIQAYFTFVQPSLLMHTINLSAGIMLLCVQCVWLLLFQVDVDMRLTTRGLGYIFVAFSLFSAVILLIGMSVDPENDFFIVGWLEALALLVNQIFFLILSFGLLLMVDHRLVADLEAVKLDITERQKAEKHLYEDRENFQRYFNMSTVGMCVISPDQRWIETNGRLRQMLGYSAEELDNLTWSKITHPDDLNADLRYYNQILSNERDSYQLDKRFIRKDGSSVYTTLFVTSHRNPVGTVRYLLASLVDITDRKQGEESLLKLAAIEERQRLARDLHDSVNQSIHGMVLFSETLVSTLEKNNTERARQIAGRLQESARQALKEARLMLYEMQTSGLVSGGDFLADLETRLATVERRAGVKGQILQEGSIEACPRDWYANLFWITIEALNNALKHAQARSMQIRICCSTERITLEISDDGIGFDYKQPRPGGLGLQNMRERAGLLGGELTIHSAPGKGSCVRFSAEIKEYHGQNQTPHYR